MGTVTGGTKVSARPVFLEPGKKDRRIPQSAHSGTRFHLIGKPVHWILIILKSSGTYRIQVSFSRRPLFMGIPVQGFGNCSMARLVLMLLPRVVKNHGQAATGLPGSAEGGSLAAWRDRIP